jgi:COP9 signalosome complex subunit 1
MERFDLETYVAKYSGHTKTARLVFIAERCKEFPQLQKNAYHMVVEMLKAGTNMSLYQKVAKDSSELLGASNFDPALVETVEKKNHQVRSCQMLLYWMCVQ